MSIHWFSSPIPIPTKSTILERSMIFTYNTIGYHTLSRVWYCINRFVTIGLKRVPLYYPFESVGATIRILDGGGGTEYEPCKVYKTTPSRIIFFLIFVYAIYVFSLPKLYRYYFAGKVRSLENQNI